MTLTNVELVLQWLRLRAAAVAAAPPRDSAPMPLLDAPSQVEVTESTWDQFEAAVRAFDGDAGPVADQGSAPPT